MGFGDNIMATGMAKGAAARGKRVAFGDSERKQIRWDHNSEIIFRNNPNVARAGSENDRNVEWVRFYRGHRLYNMQLSKTHWRWRREFKVQAGELYFSDDELEWAESLGKDFVVVEPNVPNWKQCAPNKQWPVGNFISVVKQVQSWGREVVQMDYGERYSLDGVRRIKTQDFRQAALVLSRATYAILPEGGHHHAAAAATINLRGDVVRHHVPAVVLFGGFVPTWCTGYPTHANLDGGATACGKFVPCEHCELAMRSISVDHVLQHVLPLEWRSRSG